MSRRAAPVYTPQVLPLLGLRAKLVKELAGVDQRRPATRIHLFHNDVRLREPWGSAR
jgi:hypothetical protein